VGYEVMLSSKKNGRVIYYLCLQATREGQASYAHVHEIIKGLRNLGWQVTLLEPPYAVSSRMPGPIGRMFWFLIIQMRMLIRMLVAQRPDIIYIRMHFASWLTAVCARLLHIPVVQEINGPYEDLFIAWPLTRKAAWLFKWFMRTQLRWADAVIAVTPGLAEWAKKESGNSRIGVVPNGADINLFRPDATYIGILTLPEEFVLFFGALARWQGVEVMLEALYDPGWPKSVKLVIVGDGALRYKVETAAKQNPLVVFLGQQPYRHMPGIICRSLVALVPKTDDRGGYTRTGLFPLKLFESMACGIPVVVTDFPGMADLVREVECGLVIPPNDPSALAGAVRYLYENPEIRICMGVKGRDAVVQSHSWDARAAEMGHLLQTLLIERKGS
jgi:glycosyltransferase involved in cell wall biosynthesis